MTLQQVGCRVYCSLVIQLYEFFELHKAGSAKHYVLDWSSRDKFRRTNFFKGIWFEGTPGVIRSFKVYHSQQLPTKWVPLSITRVGDQTTRKITELDVYFEGTSGVIRIFRCITASRCLRSWHSVSSFMNKISMMLVNIYQV